MTKATQEVRLDKRRLRIKFFITNYTNEGVRNNLKLFKKANSEIDLYMFLKKISRKASEAKNPAAYVVGALRKYLNNKKDEKPVNLEMSAKIDSVLNGIVSRINNILKCTFPLIHDSNFSCPLIP